MRWILLLSILLVVPGLQAQAPTKNLNQLKAFFATNCVKCHGPDGSAHTPEGKKLGGFDFTDTVKAAKESDDAMAKTVRKGILFGFIMPSFKDRLSDDEIRILVKEVLRKAEKGKTIAPSE